MLKDPIDPECSPAVQKAVSETDIRSANNAILASHPKTAKKHCGTVSFDAVRNRFVLDHIPPNIAIRLKNTFPRIDKLKIEGFGFDNTPEQCTELDWFLQRFPMRMEAAVKRRLKAQCKTYLALSEAAEAIFMPEWKPTEEARHFLPGKTPFDMQMQAAMLAVKLGRLLIMDSTGLGKSVTALTCLSLADQWPAAIVVQPHLPTQWLEEAIAEFTCFKAHIITSTTPYELPPAQIYIFKYSNIAGWVDIFATGCFKAVVYDEIQELRHGLNSDKGRAAQVLTQHALLKVGLSATPIFNYGGEIFSIIDIGLAPGALGEYADFAREWCCGYDKRGRIVKDPDALGQYLIDEHFVIRRLRQGRPVNQIVYQIPYDEDVEQQEQELVEMLAMQVVKGNFVERGRAARELDMKMREITGIAKAKYVAAYVKMLLDAGEPVILAGWHRAVYDIWLRELAAYNPVMYTGSETLKQKNQAKKSFMQGDTDLFIISLRSGSGVDGLQKRCSTVVAGELDWSPAVNSQLIGRVDRPGQPMDQVTAIFLHTDGGSDPLLINILGLKSSQAHGVTDPFQAPMDHYSDDSRMRLLAKAILAKAAARQPAIAGTCSDPH